MGMVLATARGSGNPKVFCRILSKFAIFWKTFWQTFWFYEFLGCFSFFLLEIILIFENSTSWIRVFPNTKPFTFIFGFFFAHKFQIFGTSMFPKITKKIMFWGLFFLGQSM